MPELIYDNAATEKLERIRRDREWLNQNFDWIKRRFNEMFVAIKDQDIIDHDRNLNSLLKRVTMKYEKNGRLVIIEHITDKKPIYIL